MVIFRYQLFSASLIWLVFSGPGISHGEDLLKSGSIVLANGLANKQEIPDGGPSSTLMALWQNNKAATEHLTRSVGHLKRFVSSVSLEGNPCRKDFEVTVDTDSFSNASELLIAAQNVQYSMQVIYGLLLLDRKLFCDNLKAISVVKGKSNDYAVTSSGVLEVRSSLSILSSADEATEKIYAQLLAKNSAEGRPIIAATPDRVTTPGVEENNPSRNPADRSSSQARRTAKSAEKVERYKPAPMPR